MSESRLGVDEAGAPTDDSPSSLPARPKFTRIAWILWGVGVVIFLASIMAASVTAVGASSADEYAGFSYLTYPGFAGVVWVPLGIASFVCAIIAVTRGEPSRTWAILLLVLCVITLPALFATFWFTVLV